MAWKMINNDCKLAPSIRKEDEIRGGNRLIIVHADGTEEEVSGIPSVKVDFRGKNSLIKLYEPFHIGKGHFVLNEGSYIELGAGLTVRFNLYIDAKACGTTVKIGRKVNIGTVGILAGDEEGTEVIIGDDFITSTDIYIHRSLSIKIIYRMPICRANIYIRTADGHTIYDLDTKRPVNAPHFGVHIGNHVWCGYGVTILKDADIPDNCIVGAGAIVGKAPFHKNSIIAGAPAKTVRTNVTWDSRTIGNYCRDMGIVI